MKIYCKLILFAFLGVTFHSQAQIETRTYYADEGLVPRERFVDFTYLKLKASFVPEEGKIMGEVEEKFTVIRPALDSLFLDAIRMDFTSVKLNGKEVKYENTGKGILLQFEEPLTYNTQHTLTINYSATPGKSLYFIGWQDTTHRNRKQIWTQGQGINNRHWIPMFDEKNDKLISEMLIEFDEEFEVLSNGEKLKEKKIGDGKKLWHYKISHPHSPYLIMLGIGKYNIAERKSASGVPIRLYYYPEQPEQVEPTYRYTVEMFDFFEKEIGLPYPWELYSQIPVQDYMYGAMENTTATVFGDFYLVDSAEFLDRNYVRVNAHELAHQWFGDMVTARSSAHHWLQESFATHYDMMYQREAFGEDHFNWVRKTYNDQALAASRSDLKPVAHSEAGTVRHYPKGAHVLQMLKYVVGRDAFNQAVKYYLERNAYGNVNTNDLMAAFHDKLGYSLNWFFEQWVLKGGEPHYQVSFEDFDEKGVFIVKQVQTKDRLSGLFRMPINFEVHYTDGSADRRQVWIERESEEVVFDQGNKEVEYVLFDPGDQVMKQLSFEKPTEMLKAQATKAEEMLDRYSALEQLVGRNFEGKDEFLWQRFAAEDFHAPKNLLVAYFMPQLNEYTDRMVEQSSKSDDREVRMSLLQQTFRIPERSEPYYRRLLQDPSPEVTEEALKLLGFYYPQNLDSYLEITEKRMGNRGHNVRIAWLQLAYINSGEQKHLDEIIDYAGPSFEFLTRLNAARTLENLNYLNPQAIDHLVEAAFSFNNRLRGPVSGVLDHFFKQSLYKRMMVDHLSSQSWTSEELRKIQNYLVY
jgi:aminopeptidase N